MRLTLSIVAFIATLYAAFYKKSTTPRGGSLFEKRPARCENGRPLALLCFRCMSGHMALGIGTLDNGQLLTDLLKNVQSKLQLLLSMLGGNDGTNAGLFFRHGRVTDPLREDTVGKQAVTEFHG